MTGFEKSKSSGFLIVNTSYESKNLSTPLTNESDKKYIQGVTDSTSVLHNASQLVGTSFKRNYI
jgi:hypothetical protein